LLLYRTHDNERLKRRLSLTTGLVAKQWRCALPSAFDFAVRAARDAITRHMLWLALRASVNAVQKRFSRFCQTRHGLSPRPCGSPGEVGHLSTVCNARKTHSPIIKVFVSNLKEAIGLLFLIYDFYG
jgi:hypothetical protein